MIIIATVTIMMIVVKVVQVVKVVEKEHSVEMPDTEMPARLSC